MNAQQAPAIPTTNIKLMNAAASLLFGLVLLAAVAALLWWFARLPMFALSGIRAPGSSSPTSARPSSTRRRLDRGIFPAL